MKKINGKKEIIIVVSVLVFFLTVITTICVVAADNGNTEKDSSSKSVTFDDPVDQISWDLYEAKAAKYGKSVEPEPLKDPFESYYEIATEEQRAKLDALYEEYGGLSWEHEREMKIIMGELPEDTPRLTKEDAAEICATVNVKDFDSPDAFEEYVVGLFNEVAGAPDLNGGSGITHRKYYTDDSKTDYVLVWGAAVWYYDPATDIQETLLSLTDPSDD